MTSTLTAPAAAPLDVASADVDRFGWLTLDVTDGPDFTGDGRAWRLVRVIAPTAHDADPDAVRVWAVRLTRGASPRPWANGAGASVYLRDLDRDAPDVAARVRATLAAHDAGAVLALDAAPPVKVPASPAYRCETCSHGASTAAGMARHQDETNHGVDDPAAAVERPAAVDTPAPVRVAYHSAAHAVPPAVEVPTLQAAAVEIARHTHTLPRPVTVTVEQGDAYHAGTVGGGDLDVPPALLDVEHATDATAAEWSWALDTAAECERLASPAVDAFRAACAALVAAYVVQGERAGADAEAARRLADSEITAAVLTAGRDSRGLWQHGGSREAREALDAHRLTFGRQRQDIASRVPHAALWWADAAHRAHRDA